MIVALPTLALPRRFMLGVLRRYSRSTLWLLRVVCKVDVEWRGREKLPQGAYLVACKHQSLWETFALFMLLPDPTYILKRELMWIPAVRMACVQSTHDPYRRGARAAAMAQMAARVAREIPASAPDRHLSRRHAASPRAPSRVICPVSPISMIRSVCPAYRLRSIPDCSGRAARYTVIPARCWLKSLTRSNPVSTSARSLHASKPFWRKQPHGSSRKVSNQESRGADACRSDAGLRFADHPTAEPFSDEVQIGFAIAQRFQRANGLNDVVAIGAGTAVTQRERDAGIRPASAVRHIARDCDRR